MKTKALIEIRWVSLLFAVLVIVTAIVQITVFKGGKSITSLDAYIWSSWFQTSNGAPLLMLCAAILGGLQVANEVNKGTISFLLSKPVSRTRILLSKYAVCAVALLVIALCGSLALEISGLVVGYLQNVWNLLVATLLLWLGSLFVLGLALALSVLSSNVIWPILGACVLTLLLCVPMTMPNMQAWSLIHYWSNRSAYLNGSFPLKEYVVCLILATLPVLAALALFRRRVF